MTKDIPDEWIRKYIDQLLEAAGKFGPDTAMGQACMLRADHVMDMVKQWRESQGK